jgi:hypothetical protein
MLPGIILVRVCVIKNATDGNARIPRHDTSSFHLKAQDTTYYPPVDFSRIGSTPHDLVPRGNQPIVNLGYGFTQRSLSQSGPVTALTSGLLVSQPMRCDPNGGLLSQMLMSINDRMGEGIEDFGFIARC